MCVCVCVCVCVQQQKKEDENGEGGGIRIDKRKKAKRSKRFIWSMLLLLLLSLIGLSYCWPRTFNWLPTDRSTDRPTNWPTGFSSHLTFPFLEIESTRDPISLLFSSPFFPPQLSKHRALYRRALEGRLMDEITSGSLHSRERESLHLILEEVNSINRNRSPVQYTVKSSSVLYCEHCTGTGYLHRSNRATATATTAADF